MINSYKKSGHVFIILAIILSLLWCWPFKAEEFIIIKPLFFMVGMVLFIAGCYSYAKGKGYSTITSILFGIFGSLNIIGLIIVAVLTDKTKLKENSAIAHKKNSINTDLSLSDEKKKLFSSSNTLKYIIFIIIILILTIVSISIYLNDEDAFIEKVTESENNFEIADRKNTNITSTQNQDQNRIEYDTNQGLTMMQNLKGVDPESFYYGPCVYLHGDDSKIRNWLTYDENKKNNLALFFKDFPLVKLDYSKNPNDISDEIIIGPICDCTQYNQAKNKIKEYNLDFPWILAHGKDNLKSCVDFSDFK